MPIKTPALALAALAAMMTAGFALAERGAPEADTAAALSGTSWALVALNGEAVAEDVDTTLNFGDDGSVGGNGGCNSYGGSIAYEEDGSIAITEVFSTMMACPEPQMGQERGFFAALGAAERAAITDEVLSLYDGSGMVVAELTPREASE